MMLNPGKALLTWWQNASPRARLVGGIILFSLVCTALLFMLLDTPASSAAGGSQSLDLSAWYIFGVFFKLIFVLGLILGGAALVRKYGNRTAAPNAARQLEMLETLRVGPRQSLHLVRVGSKRLLVGSTDQALALISDLGEIEEAEALSGKAPQSAQPASFDTILASAVRNADAAAPGD